VNLNPITKWVSHKKTLPWSRPAWVNRHTRRFKPRSHSFHVRAFQPEVPVRISLAAIFLD